MKPREYQGEAISAADAEFDAGRRSTLIVMPTGTGKTVVAAHIAHRRLSRGRCMVLAHRDELIRQAAEKFETVTGEACGIEKGQERSEEDTLLSKPKIVISSFQTQNSGDGTKRMHRFNPMDFSILWVDEAHHALAPSYRAVIDYYLDGNPELKLLGVTATPDRADGDGLGKVFESVAYSYDLPDAIHDGYLVPIRQHSVLIDGLDFSKVRTTAGDLNAQDLEAAMIAEKPLHGIAHATIEVACGLKQHCLHEIKDEPERASILAGWIGDRRRRKTLIFTVTVSHAEKMAEILNRWIPQSATHVDGKMPMDDRRRRLEEFSTGQRQFLVNCMVASEGYDEPGIELVVMARPTKSRALFAQQVGRGTRPLKELADRLGDLADADERRAMIVGSPKPHVEILDFVGNSGKHKLITCADLLGADGYEEAVIEAAKELAQAEAVDVEAALEQASIEFDEEAEVKRLLAEKEAQRLDEEDEQRRLAEVAKRASIVATSLYQMSEVDSLDRHAYVPPRESEISRTGGATEKQVALLVKLGVQKATAAKYTVKQAGAVITSLKSKRCTSGQAWKLRSLGFTQADIDGMNFDMASAEIDRAMKGAAA